MNPRPEREFVKSCWGVSQVRHWLSVDVTGLRLWLIVMAIAFLALLALCILALDIPHSSFEDWLTLVYLVLFGAVAAATGTAFAEWVFRRCNRARRETNLLVAWLLIVVVFAFIAVFIFCIVSLDSTGNTFDDRDRQGFAFFMLLSGAIFATVVVGIWAFIRGVSSWQNFRRFVFRCACVAALIAVFYCEEDWKGKHQWDKFKREWEAKGENFDRASVVPQPVPDDQNFAMSPVWIAELKRDYQTQSGPDDWYPSEPGLAAAWYGNRINSYDVSNYFKLLPMSISTVVVTNNEQTFFETPDTLGNWPAARVSDLGPWQSFYRNMERTNPAAGIIVSAKPQTPAQDVLLALSKYDPLIERLRRDSQLPYSRFPISYGGDNQDPEMILFPHLGYVKGVAQVLELRAIAELQNKQSEKALADVRLMLRLVDADRTEPFLISHLIRIAVLEIALQPIYEGLANHEWSDSQLSELDSKLLNFDFVNDYKFVMRGEMIVLQDGSIDFLRRHPGRIFAGTSLGEGVSDSNLADRTLGSLVPGGWFYQNELHLDRAMEEFDLPVVDTRLGVLSPSSVCRAQAAAEADTSHFIPYKIMERMIAYYELGSAMRVAFGQNSVNLARVAIALERYRFAHGEYPDSLNTLSPQFIVRLPHDVINGQPLHYHRTANGQFILYSVGWNEKDDGGNVVFFKAESTPAVRAMPAVDDKQGDWVWRYPEK